MKEDRVYLVYILECIANIEELSSQGRDILNTHKHNRAAVLYYLHTLAEATQRLSGESKANHSEVDWLGISGFRNRLVHGYLAVNMDIVWSVIENYLPQLKKAAQAMLAELDNE